MAASPTRNRRTLVLSAVAGVITGGAWGAAIQALAKPSTPTLSIIGKRGTQVILLDTTRLRVLILCGTPDGELQAQIPALLTMLRQRIDILVGTSAALDALGHEFWQRWRVSHSLVLADGGTAGQDTSTQTWITGAVGAELGDGVSIDFSLTTRDEWDVTMEPRSLWAVTVRAGWSVVTLAPDMDSALVLSAPGSTLVVVPQGNANRLMATLLPASIAVNSADDLTWPTEDPSGAVLVRIYPEDISRFELRDDGIALPTWAEGNS
jgi:hypothetical protein